MAVEIHKLSEDEGKDIFERACQRDFNMSTEEWLDKWDSGEFHMGHDHPDHIRITHIYMLLPLIGRR